MSTSIEQRVVQMRFDNKQFEAGVAQSMSTLDKLKAKLSFKNSAKDFEELERAAKNVDLSSIGDQADKVSVKFDALAVVAVTALQRMTNAAIDAGKNMAKSLTIDQVTAGWNKYTEKTASVQTIMNATGKSIEEVNGYLDKLMWFSDETSYSFNDMTAAMGQMTATGGDIEKIVPLLYGVANATAYAGKGATEFSRVMYNLNQSYGQGYLSLMDWRSVQNAGVASKQLTEELIRAGEELGKISKGSVTLQNFTDKLSDKWADTSVMELAFGRFGEMSLQAYEMVQQGMVDTASEAYELLAQTNEGFGIVAARAAQEAKSFSEAIDATKDAVSSGWMKTFEIIFGNYEEAKTLWTDLANTMWDLFASGADARNEMLQWWKDIGGRTAAIKAVQKAFSNLMKVIDALSSGFKDIFPPMTFQQLFDITLAVKNFIYQLELSDEAVNTLRVAFKALLLPVKAIVTVFEIGVVWAGRLALALFKLVDSIIALPSKVNALEKPLRKIFGDERYERIASAFSVVAGKLGDALGIAGQKASELVGSLTTLAKSSVANAIRSLIEALTPLGSWILDRIVDGIEALANADYSQILGWARSGLDSLKTGFAMLLGLLQNGVKGVKEFFAQFNITSPMDVLKGLVGALAAFGQGTLEFIKSLGGEKILNAIGTAASNLAGVIKRLGTAIYNVLSLLTPGKILVFSFGTALVYTVAQIGNAFKALSGVGESVSGMFKSVGGVFDAIKDRIKPNLMQKISASIIQFAVAITILSGALALISTINPDRLWSSFGALASLIGVLAGFSTLMTVLNRTLVKTPEMANNLMKLGVALIAMTGSVAILSGALLVLSKIDTEGIGTKLLIMGTAIATLIGASIIVGKYSKDLASSAIFIIAFAGSMLLVARSLKVLGEVDLTGSIANVTIVLSVMAALAVVSRIMTRTTKSIGDSGQMTSKMQGLTGLILNLVLLVGVLKVLSMMDTANLVTGLINMIPVFLALITLAGITRIAGDQSAKMGGQVLAISAAIILLSFALERIGSIDQGIIDRAMGVIGSLMVMFGLIILLSKVGGSSNVKMGSTFLGMAAAIMILGLAIDYIGNLSLKAAVQGTIVVGVVLALFGVLMVASSLVSSAKGTITAMTVAIGLLVASLALLTLLDFNELMGSAVALGTVLVAFGAAMKLMSGLKMSSAIGSMLVLLSAVSILGLTFGYLREINPQSTLAYATGIAEVLVALGVAMALLRRKRGENDVALATIGTMGLILLEMSGVMLALSLMPAGENLITKATAMGEIMLALSSSMVLLGLAKVPTGLAETLIAMSVMLVEALGVVTLLSIIPADDSLIKKATALSIVLLAMSGAMAIISAIGMGLSMLGAVAGPALVGALAAEGIILSLIALIEIIGVAFDKFDALESGLAKAEDVLPRIGLVFGQFIGNLVGGLIGGALGGTIEAFGTSLSNFANNVSDFLNLRVSEETVDAIGRLAIIAGFITGAEFIESILRFGRDSSLEAFGQQLANFGPYFATFAQSISGIPVDAVTASATCLEALSSVLASIPTDGGLLGMIFGNASLESFGIGLTALATGLASYATVIKAADIDNSTLTTTNNLANTLVTLANKVPKTGGLVNFLGAHDIGKFGEQLSLFADGLSQFLTKVSDMTIDDDKVKAVGDASSMLVNLANDVPKTGTLVTFLGGHDIGAFGTQLVEFAEGLKKFFSNLANVKIDQDKANGAKIAGETLVSLAESVPKTGALLTFFGANDIGAFGTQIGSFGQGLASFFTALNDVGLDQGQVDLAKNAGLAFTEIADAVGTNTGLSTLFEGTSLETFGDQIGGLGKGLATYYTNISGVDWDIVSKSIDELKRIVELAPSLGTVNAQSVGTFKTFLTNLAQASVTKFTEAFQDAEETISETIYTTINNAISTAKTSIERSEAGYSFVVDAIVAGMSQQAYLVDDEGRSIAQRFLDVIRNSKNLFEQAGKIIIDTLVTTMESTLESSRKRLADISKKFVTAIESALGIGSGGYSSEFYDVGKACIDGYVRGLNRNQGSAFDALKRLGADIASTFHKAMQMHSPPAWSIDAGEQTDEGYAEGVEDNESTALDAVQELGESILDEFGDALDVQNGVSLEGVDLGETLDVGIGEGILDSGEYAYEAAGTVADGILDVFKDRFSQIGEAMNILDQEFELWAALNPISSYSDGTESIAFGQGEYTKRQFEVLQSKLMNQADRVAIADASYQSSLAQFGADAEQTKNAYSAYLSAQMDMIDLSTSMQELQMANQENWLKYAQTLNSVHGGLIEQGFSEEEIRNAVSSMTGWVDMKSAVTGGVSDIMSSYMQSALPVEELITEAMTAATEEAEKSAKESGVKTIQNYSAGITEAASSGGELSNAVDTVKQTVTDGITPNNLYDKFKDTAAGGAEGLIDGASSFLDKIKSAGMSIGNSIDSGAREALDEHSPSKVMEQDGIWAVEGLSEGVTNPSAVAQLESAANETATKAENVFKESAQEYPNIGISMMQGLAQGIQSGASEAINAAVQVAQQALAAAQAALGIHSPSKKFYEIGQMIDQGLSNGILDDYSIVDGSISKIVERLEEPVVVSAVIDLDDSAVEKKERYWKSGQLAIDQNGNLLPFWVSQGYDPDNPNIKKQNLTFFELHGSAGGVDYETLYEQYQQTGGKISEMTEDVQKVLNGIKESAERNNTDRHEVYGGVDPTTVNVNITSPTPADPAEVARRTRNAVSAVRQTSNEIIHG